MIGFKSERRLFLRKLNQVMAVWLNKCHIKLRGTKEGQECASIGHLEISAMSSGEKPRKSRGILNEPERYKRYYRSRTGVYERNNRGTEDVQQRYMR